MWVLLWAQTLPTLRATRPSLPRRRKRRGRGRLAPRKTLNPIPNHLGIMWVDQYTCLDPSTGVFSKSSLRLIVDNLCCEHSISRKLLLSVALENAYHSAVRWVIYFGPKFPIFWRKKAWAIYACMVGCLYRYRYIIQILLTLFNECPQALVFISW